MLGFKKRTTARAGVGAALLASAAVTALGLGAGSASAAPFCSGSSITGQGVRDTLKVAQEVTPLAVREVPSGTQVFDWTVPDEWNVREAWVKGPAGRKVIDFADHNLHLLNYSVPFCGTLTLEELRPHLYTLPDRPEWIPYRTSYYKEDWGFCL